MPRPVLDKKDFYVRWADGEFGNWIRSWNSLEALMASPYEGDVNIRNITPSSKNMRFGVPKALVPQVLTELDGHITQFRFNEPAPDEQLVIQGELCELVGGWCLTYNTAKVKMREAMEHPKTARGLDAKLLLRSACDPSSFDDLGSLLDLYPDHVIEFGVYRNNVGNIPHRNTLIWEVRNY